MGIYHFSGLFVLLCLGLGSALLSSLGEHIFYHLVLPCIRRGNRLQYWLHTSQRIHLALNTEPVEKQKEPEPRDLEKQQDIPTARSGQGNWTRVCQAMVRERHLHLLREPTLATAPSVVGTGVEGNQPPEGPIQLCSNGQPPTMLPTGAPRPGELEELEQHIADARSRLRQALVRRGELLAQLPGGSCDGPLCLL